jgi:hypothetical protein
LPEMAEAVSARQDRRRRSAQRSLLARVHACVWHHPGTNSCLDQRGGAAAAAAAWGRARHRRVHGRGSFEKDAKGAGAQTQVWGAAAGTRGSLWACCSPRLWGRAEKDANAGGRMAQRERQRGVVLVF